MIAQNWSAQIRSSLRRIGLVSSGMARFGQASLELVWSNQIWAVLVCLDLAWVNSGEVWLRLVWSDQTGKVWAGQVRIDLVRLSQVSLGRTGEVTDDLTMTG